MSLYHDLKAAGVPMSSHESDLYFPIMEQTRAILAKYPVEKGNATTFTNQVEGGLWFDVPFSYLPWWEARKSRPYQPKTGAKCGCRRGIERDNCPNCEGTGWVIDFRAIRARKAGAQ